MNQKDSVKVIEKLVEVCKDGQKGYKDAAEHVKRSDLKTLFTAQSSERGRFARELQAVLSQKLYSTSTWSHSSAWQKQIGRIPQFSTR